MAAPRPYGNVFSACFAHARSQRFGRVNVDMPRISGVFGFPCLQDKFKRCGSRSVDAVMGSYTKETRCSDGGDMARLDRTHVSGFQVCHGWRDRP
jgi:hypothetical protein